MIKGEQDMRTGSKKLLVGVAAAAILAGSASGAASYSGGSWGGGNDELKAASYINGDAGKNADVDPGSSCFRRDQHDAQAFSDPATGNPGNNNVHNDACFLDRDGNKRGKNIGATFRSKGVGYISACPDPDGAGPAFSRLRDLDGDGRNDSCFQSSYQERGIAGDLEYHARVNNTGMTGTQDVDWGMDRDADGRIDSYEDDSIKVDWSASGLSGSSYDGRW